MQEKEQMDGRDGRDGRAEDKQGELTDADCIKFVICCKGVHRVSVVLV